MPISYMASNGKGHYLQKRIPKDLLHHYPECRSGIIKRYLHTDRAEAIRKLALGLARLEEEFAAKRRGPSVTELTDSHIERLTAIRVHELLDEDEEARREGLDSERVFAATSEQLKPYGVASPWKPEVGAFGHSDREYEKAGETLDGALSVYRDALARGKIDLVAEDVGELLAAEGITLPKTSEAHRKLSFAILKAHVKATELMQQRQQGELVDTPPRPAFEGKNRSTGDGGARLSDIFDKWKAERNPPVKTASDFGTYVRRFIEVNGDLAVKSITKSHVVAFKDAMLKYPARLQTTMSKNTVPQILAKFKDDKTTPRLSPRTVNDKALGAIGAVLGWALSNGHCETNAANGVKVAMGEVRTDRRLPYSIADMNRIFSFPLLTPA